MKRIKDHLCNNSGVLGIDRMIIIVIAFVAGAILIAAVIAAIIDGYEPGVGDRIHDILE